MIYDYVMIGENRYELREKASGNKVNIAKVIIEKFDKGQIKKK